MFGNDCWYQSLNSLYKLKYQTLIPLEKVKTLIQKYNQEVTMDFFQLGEPMSKDLLQALMLEFQLGCHWIEKRDNVLIEDSIFNSDYLLPGTIEFTYSTPHLIGHFQFLISNTP